VLTQKLAINVAAICRSVSETTKEAAGRCTASLGLGYDDFSSFPSLNCSMQRNSNPFAVLISNCLELYCDFFSHLCFIHTYI